jgi:hypothetical protein
VENKRVAARTRVFKTGYIVFSDKVPKLECAVRNVSDTGASLQVSTTIGIPTSFDVIKGRRTKIGARLRGVAMPARRA